MVRAPCMGACDRAPVAAVGHVQTFKATPDTIAADVQGEQASARLAAAAPISPPIKRAAATRC